MDAIIGRYRVRLEETGLVLKHPTGISFDMTLDEALGLWKFISVYQESLNEILRETDPQLQRIVLNKEILSED
jgi:hypothetical protein